MKELNNLKTEDKFIYAIMAERRKQGYNQKEFAKKVGIGAWVQHALESRLKALSIDMAIKQANALGMSWDELVKSVKENPLFGAPRFRCSLVFGSRAIESIKGIKSETFARIRLGKDYPGSLVERTFSSKEERAAYLLGVTDFLNQEKDDCKKFFADNWDVKNT